MTTTQHDLLTLIREHTEWENDDASQAVVLFWVPPTRGSQFSETLQREIYVSGPGVAASLLAMERKGWIKPQTFNYSYSVTEDGILALEKHRETTGFYVA